MDQYEDDAQYYAKMHKQLSAKNSKLVDAIIRFGFAKDSKGAQILLCVFAGICIITTLIIVVQKQTPATPTPTEKIPEHIKKALSKDFLEGLSKPQ